MIEHERLYEAFVVEARDYWPMSYELLAIIAELMHTQIRQFAKANGAKGKVRPLRIPRPYADTHVAEETQVRRGTPLTSLGEYLKQLRG